MMAWMPVSSDSSPPAQSNTHWWLTDHHICILGMAVFLTVFVHSSRWECACSDLSICTHAQWSHQVKGQLCLLPPASQKSPIELHITLTKPAKSGLKAKPNSPTCCYVYIYTNILSSCNLLYLHFVVIHFKCRAIPFSKLKQKMIHSSVLLTFVYKES